MRDFKVLGLMSGTSLDGLDIAFCNFSNEQGVVNYEILDAVTIPYNDVWENKLKNAFSLKSEKLLELHSAFGQHQGEIVTAFLRERNISIKEVDLIGSHGHTVFHQPEKQLTFQLGNGALLSNVTGIPVICDFRSQDVALKGQGAPLVPIGDEMLFGEYKFCLNIGGIANISFEKQGKRVAWDICPANMVLNYFTQKINRPYDKNGEMAASGTINKKLLRQLNSLDFYVLQAPKTLGREWVYSQVIPMIESERIALADILATFNEHIAIQIGKLLIGNKEEKLLITGGGAYNSNLIERIKKYSNVSVNIPDNRIVEFKEALIFALLGYLKWNNKTNILSSVTGAIKDHSSGVLYDC